MSMYAGKTAGLMYANQLKQQAYQNALRQQQIKVALKAEAMKNQSQLAIAQQAAQGRAGLSAQPQDDMPDDVPRQHGEPISAPLTQKHRDLQAYMKLAATGNFSEAEKEFDMVKGGTSHPNADGSVSAISSDGHPVTFPLHALQIAAYGKSEVPVQKTETTSVTAKNQAMTQDIMARAGLRGATKPLTAAQSNKIAEQDKVNVASVMAAKDAVDKARVAYQQTLALQPGPMGWGASDIEQKQKTAQEGMANATTRLSRLTDLHTDSLTRMGKANLATPANSESDPTTTGISTSNPVTNPSQTAPTPQSAGVTGAVQRSPYVAPPKFARQTPGEVFKTPEGKTYSVVTRINPTTGQPQKGYYLTGPNAAGVPVTPGTPSQPQGIPNLDLNADMTVPANSAPAKPAPAAPSAPTAQIQIDPAHEKIMVQAQNLLKQSKAMMPVSPIQAAADQQKATAVIAKLTDMYPHLQEDYA